MRGKDIQPVTIERLLKEADMPHIGNDIVLVEKLQALPRLAKARRLSLCFFVGLCTSGVCSISVNGRKRIASRNQVMLITDESVVDSINYSEDLDGIGFFLSYKFLQELLRDIPNMSDIYLLTHNYPVFDVNDAERATLQRCFGELLLRMSAEGHRYRMEIVHLIVLAMIYDVSNVFDRIMQSAGQEDKQSSPERLFVRFIQYVKQNFREQRQVQWYANQLEVSPKYLCEAINNVSRRSPNEWIDKFATTEIRNQLRHTNKRISQIASELNFSTQSSLGKYFKENVGVSPTDYRNGIEK